jgi:hypothetical protein
VVFADLRPVGLGQNHAHQVVRQRVSRQANRTGLHLRY